MLSMAQATKRCGGLVIVQVKRLARRGTLPAKNVKIPAMLVDLVVVDAQQAVTYQSPNDPAFTGEFRIPLNDFPLLPLDERKIVVRRFAMELLPGAVCNVGSGICTGIGLVSAEEDVLDSIVFTNGKGLSAAPLPPGWMPAPCAITARWWTSPISLIFTMAAGLISPFFPRPKSTPAAESISAASPTNSSASAVLSTSVKTPKKWYSAAHLPPAACTGGQLHIEQEGAHRKFVAALQQISYSGPYAASGVRRCCSSPSAPCSAWSTAHWTPGIDLERDVLQQMAFRPRIAADLKSMDARLFLPQPMGLHEEMAAKTRARHPRLAQLAPQVPL